MRASPLVLLLALSRFAPAAEVWPAASLRLAAAHNSAPPAWYHVTNPFLITLTDQMRLAAAGWGKLWPGSGEVTLLAESGEFREPGGSRSGFRIRFWPRPGGGPLLVYLPGIFQGAADEDTSRVVSTMIESGYQVAVFPNPLSAEYARNFPVAPPSSYAREAGIIREAVAELSRRTGGRDVRLLAASHNAILGARVWAADQAAGVRLVEDLTILFPQWEIKKSIELVDSYVSTPKLRDLPRASIGKGYQISLGKMVGRMKELYLRDRAAGFRARSYPPRAARALRRYLAKRDSRRLNLRTVLQKYIASPDVDAGYENGQDRLRFWLDQAYAVRGDRNVRLLTASDDWTNPPGPWDEIPEWLAGPDRTLVLERAGHAGVVAREWFRLLILEGMRVQ